MTMIQTTDRVNVYDKNEARAKFKYAIDVLYSVIKNSYGPLASNTMIVKKEGSLLTKDGITIISNLRSKDVNIQEIIKIFTGISSGINSSVGDGTTSAIVLLKHLCDEFNEYFTERTEREGVCLHSRMVDEVRTVIYQISHELDKYANQVNSIEDIKQIAEVSLNGNSSLMKMINETYITDDDINNNIIVKIDFDNKVERFSNAYSCDGKLVNSSFGNKKDGSFEYINKPYNELSMDPVRVIVFDGDLDGDQERKFVTELTNMITKEITLSQSMKTIIISPVLHPLFRDEILKLQLKFKDVSPFALMEQKTMTPDIMEDLAMFIGVDLIRTLKNSDLNDPKTISTLLSKNCVSQNIKSINSNGIKTIFEVNPQSINNRQTDLEDRIKRIDYIINSDTEISNPPKYRKNLLDKKRLSGRLTEISLGSVTAESTGADKTALEDCVNAIEKSIKYGFNVGQNLIVPYAINKMETNDSPDIYNRVMSAYKKTLKDLLQHNYTDDIWDKSINERLCFNPITNEFDNSIINPSILDKRIIEVLAEGLRLFFDTNQILGSTYDSVRTYNVEV